MLRQTSLLGRPQREKMEGGWVGASLAAEVSSGASKGAKSGNFWEKERCTKAGKTAFAHWRNVKEGEESSSRKLLSSFLPGSQEMCSTQCGHANRASPGILAPL